MTDSAAPARAPAGSVLHALSWNLTARCNLRCGHCYLDASVREARDAHELDRAECLALVDELAAVNPQLFLILTGGEPLCHPWLEDIVARATGAGMTVVLGTNGTLLTADRARALKAQGLSGVGISIDAPESEAHDRLRGVAGAWAGAMEGLRIARDCGLGIVVQTSIFSWNRTGLDRLARLAADVGAAAHNVYFLVCTGRGQGMTDLDAETYEATLEDIRALQSEWAGRLHIGVKCAPHYQRLLATHEPASPHLRGYAGGCPAGTHYARVDPMGQATPCPYLPPTGESVREQPFAEIWTSAAPFTTIRERSALGGKCGGCDMVHVCGGCRARAFALEGDVMAEDPSCAYEPPERDAAAPAAFAAAPAAFAAAQTFGAQVELTMAWTPEARDRLDRIPSFLRGMITQRLEAAAREAGADAVTAEMMRELRERGMGGGMPAGRIPAGAPPFPIPEAPGPSADSDRESVGCRKDEEIQWDADALARLANAPDFVRPGIRKLMGLRARQRGHTRITSEFLSEIRNESMLRVATVVRRFGFDAMEDDAFGEAKQRMHKRPRKLQVIDAIREFLGARTEKNEDIIAKFEQYMAVAPTRGVAWTPDALEWLEEHDAEGVREDIEARVRALHLPVVSLELIQELYVPK